MENLELREGCTGLNKTLFLSRHPVCRAGKCITWTVVLPTTIYPTSIVYMYILLDIRVRNPMTVHVSGVTLEIVVTTWDHLKLLHTPP